MYTDKEIPFQIIISEKANVAKRAIVAKCDCRKERIAG